MPPLDDVLTIARWLSEIVGAPLDVTQRRLLAECHFVGHNVYEASREFGLVPHVWSERMLEFYGSTDAFLFETVAWNSTRMKGEMRATVCEGLRKRLSPGARVLCFGDGMGFDSVAIAKCGFQVTCYEVSGKCLDFARRLFLLNGVDVLIETDTARFEPGSFDAIVCLDVLEHLPDPVASIIDFSNWLTETGILVAHAPFYHVDQTRPTHLASNRHYSGKIGELYGQAGFQVLETGGPLLNPLFLQKSPVPLQRSLRTRLRVRLARAIVRVARSAGPVPRLVAAVVCKPPVHWRQTLERELHKQST